MPDDANDVNWAAWLQRKHDIYLNRICASCKISIRAESSHDALSRKEISKKLIDTWGLTGPVVTENVFIVFMFLFLWVMQKTSRD